MHDTIWVNSEQLVPLKKEAQKWEKKAKILECPAPSIIFTEECRMISSSRNKRFSNKEYKVLLSGKAPCLDDWKVLMQIDHQKFNDGYENIIKHSQISEQDLPTIHQYNAYTAPPHCDHCNTKRKRKTTFLLMHNTTSEIVQIGSTCVEDFVEKVSLKHLLFQFSIIHKIRKFTALSTVQEQDKCKKYVAIKDYVDAALMTIDEKGFIGKEESYLSGEPKTYESTNALLISTEKECLSHNHTSQIMDKLAAVTSKNTNFAINLKGILSDSSGFMNIENRYACAMVTGAVKRCYDDIKKGIENIRFLHQHIGILKQRREFLLTLIEDQIKQTNYGDKHVFFFTDNKNRKVKWTCWGKLPDVEMKENQQYHLTATISEHENYSIPTTVINRCKNVQVV